MSGGPAPVPRFRILHLLASPVWSGPAEGVALLARAQRALGHEVHVAIDRTREGTGTEEPAGPRFEALGLLDEGDLRLRTREGALGVLRDARALRRRALDVVHAHLSHDHWVAWAGRPRGAAVVRSIHAARSLRAFRPPAAAWTAPTSALGARLDGPWERLPALLEETLRPADDRARLQTSLGLSAPVVGMVSTFQPSRRHALALEAFVHVRARAPSATLALVGDGVLEPALRAQTRALGLDAAVRFAGYQSGAALVRWLQALDELWVLGLGNDGAGRAALQGRAAGARVVAVAEGDLPAWADVVLPAGDAVPLTADVLAAAALGSSRRPDLSLPDPAEVAGRILALYARARAG